jgi:hypothetical protein
VIASATASVRRRDISSGSIAERICQKCGVTPRGGYRPPESFLCPDCWEAYTIVQAFRTGKLDAGVRSITQYSEGAHYQKVFYPHGDWNYRHPGDPYHWYWAFHGSRWEVPTGITVGSTLLTDRVSQGHTWRSNWGDKRSHLYFSIEMFGKKRYYSGIWYHSTGWVRAKELKESRDQS